jgi:hypothetical protein
VCQLPEVIELTQLLEVVELTQLLELSQVAELSQVVELSQEETFEFARKTIHVQYTPLAVRDWYWYRRGCGIGHVPPTPPC